MDRGIRRGNPTSENLPFSSLLCTSPALTCFQRKIRTKEEQTGRQTRGPTLSCQSHSVTERHISHDPLQRVCSYSEHVRHVIELM